MTKYAELRVILDDKIAEINHKRMVDAMKWLDEVADPIFRETASKGCSVVVVENLPKTISWAMVLSILSELGYEHAKIDEDDLVVAL